MEALPQCGQSPALPRLGQPAPPFQAETTHGTLRLEDFKGSWLILFSHPADFTPVCTTEFIEFAKIAPDLRRRGVELLGLSIDSTYSHIAWVRNIEQHFNVKIPFFVIDPNQVVRAMIYYPLTTGRNMDEILRLIDALQTTDKHGVATPANWRPGEQVIVPPPRTIEAAAERATMPGIECTDWYFAKRDLPK